MQTATNPETGERVQLVDGQWQPIKTASNPQTGERVELIGGEWVPIKTEPNKPSLRQNIVEGIRDFKDSNVFPDGIAESALDAVTGGVASLIENPVGAIKKAGKTLAVDPAVSILKAPANFADAVGGSGLALQSAIEGDQEAAAFQGNRALGKATDAAVGALEAATLGRGGVLARPAQQAVNPRRAAQLDATEDFLRSNVEPSIATVANSDAPAKLAQNIGENIIAGGNIRRNVKRQVGQAVDRKDAIADSLDPGADASVAGEAIINGVAAHRSLAGRHYEEAFERIDVEASAPRSNQTLAKIEGELRKFDNEELQAMFEPATLKKLKPQLEGGGDISIRDLRQLRTEVRLAKGRPKVNQTQDEAAIISLERSLTDDLYNAIEATSGTEAVNALKRADKFYARTLQRVDKALKPFSKLDQTNEGSFAALRTAMKGQTASRGRGNFKQLEELKKALSPQEMDTVKAGIFRDMGRTSEGADFSTTHFVTTWNQFGNKQKDIIFGTGEVRKDMDALVNVMTRLDRLPKAANVSQSGSAIQNVTTIAGLANPSTFKVVAGGLAAMNVTGRVMTNPRYVKTLRFIAEAEATAARTGDIPALLNAKKRALASVGAIEAADETLRGELQPLKDALNDNSPPLREVVRQAQ